MNYSQGGKPNKTIELVCQRDEYCIEVTQHNLTIIELAKLNSIIIDYIHLI